MSLHRYGSIYACLLLVGFFAALLSHNRSQINTLDKLVAVRRSECAAIGRQIAEQQKAVAEQLERNAAISKWESTLPKNEQHWLSSQATQSNPKGATTPTVKESLTGSIASLPDLIENTPHQIYFQALLGIPSYSSAVALIEKHQVEADYEPLFEELNLNHQQEEALTGLLVDSIMIKEDVEGIAGGAALTDKSKARAKLMRSWRKKVTEALGAKGMADVRDYDETLRYRKMITSLEIRLSYTDSPLAASQSERLLNLLEGSLGTKTKSRYWSIPDATITNSRTFLSPTQIRVLGEIQEEQLALIKTRDEHT